jgi:hypothetical protein
MAAIGRRFAPSGQCHVHAHPQRFHPRPAFAILAPMAFAGNAGLFPQVQKWLLYGISANGVVMTLVPIGSLFWRLVTFAGFTVAFGLAPVLRSARSRRRAMAPIVEDHLLRSTFDRELAAAARQGRSPWWAGTDETVTLPGFFAFWAKSEGHDAARVALQGSEGHLHPESLGLHGISPAQPSRKKACLTGLDGLLSDQLMTARFATIDWETVQAIESGTPDSTGWSLFGIDGWAAWPSLAVAHCIVQTSDSFVLFTLRNRKGTGDRFYFPSCWSTSFEEQIELGDQPDHTLQDTVCRGLKEEYGLARAAVADTTCLAVGREIADAGGRRVRNAGLIVSVRLNVPVAEVWKALDRKHEVRDRLEGRAWYGCRFASRLDLDHFLQEYPVSTAPSGAEAVRDNSLLRCVVNPYRGGPEAEAVTQWHPTSHARLRLWRDHAYPRQGMPAPAGTAP